jgi:hypothetical protein
VVTNPGPHCTALNMQIISRNICYLAMIAVCAMGSSMSIADDLNNVPVSAPIDTDSAGRAGDIATHAVIRLLCVEHNTVGTGFLHKSGNIITADHVVRGCTTPQMVLP